MEMKQPTWIKRMGLVAVSAVAMVALSACGQTSDNQASSSSQASSEMSTQSESKTAAVTEMSGAELDKALEDTKAKENYVVLDVRDNDTYKMGTVKYAINIPTADLESKLDQLNDYKDKKTIVTIADTKSDSEAAAKQLMDKGFTKVANADGMKDYDYTVITKVQFVLPKDLQEAADSGKYTVLDARDEKDYNAGHLKGAKRINVKNLDEEIKQVPKDKPVITYCYSGNKSYKAAQKLVDEGWDNVYNANDGTKEHDYELVQE